MLENRKNYKTKFKFKKQLQAQFSMSLKLCKESIYNMYQVIMNPSLLGIQKKKIEF